MGKILKTKLKTGLEGFIVAIVALVIGAGIYTYAPGLRTGGSKQLNVLDVDKNNIDNVSKTDMVSLPADALTTSLSTVPVIRVAGYGWNGMSSLIVANGGPQTTKNSLIEQQGIRLDIVRQDWFSELKNMQIKFVEEFDKGVDFPASDKAAPIIVIMGDGGPFYISTVQKALDEKFGKGKYHVQIIGATGMSYGEDKVIGPVEWKTNPMSMKGALISTVLGDGDWVVLVNWCFANGLKVNTDVTTYDAEAVNVLPSENDDYMNAAKELIKSQKTGWSVELKEVSNGKLTGKTVKKKVDGCSTWTPGDKLVFDELNGFTDIISTKEFNNQMATTFITIKEWALKHEKEVTNVLKASFTASNQMKQFEPWKVKASECVAKTFKAETPKYWHDMFNGVSAKKNGVSYAMGGTKVLNYADAMQYYGIGGDGVNRYKSVYNQVSTYLTELNPYGFNENVGKVVPYEEAVNLYFIKNINDVESGTVDKADYTETKTEVMASREWHINFSTGSAEISKSSTKELENIYNLLVQAENTKLKVIGHTDNTGYPGKNLTLSKDRSNSVVEYLVDRGIPRNRFQEVDGMGDTEPVASNSTVDGKSKNRRVVVSFLN